MFNDLTREIRDGINNGFSIGMSGRDKVSLADLANLKATMDPSNAQNILSSAAREINSGMMGRFQRDALMRLGSGVQGLSPQYRKSAGLSPLEGYEDGGYIDGPVDIDSGDDTVINAKIGEYIIPEEAVRYIGLDKLNKMVMSAKQNMGEVNPQEHLAPKGNGYDTGGLIDPNKRNMGDIIDIQQANAGYLSPTQSRNPMPVQDPRKSLPGPIPTAVRSNLNPPQEAILAQPKIPERGRSLGYMTDGTTAQEMFRGPQGDYAAPTTLADLARQDWQLDPEGAAKIPVSIGGTEGYYGDPTLKGRALQNFVDVENAGIQPTSEKDRPAWLGLRSTLGKMGSQEDIAALRADMQQKTNEANLQNRMAIAEMNNQRAMDIANMNNERARDLAANRSKPRGGADKTQTRVQSKIESYKKKMDELWGKEGDSPAYRSYRRALQNIINQAEKKGVDWDNTSVGLDLVSNKPTSKPPRQAAPTAKINNKDPRVQAAMKAGYTAEEILAYLARGK